MNARAFTHFPARVKGDGTYLGIVSEGGPLSILFEPNIPSVEGKGKGRELDFHDPLVTSGKKTSAFPHTFSGKGKG